MIMLDLYTATPFRFRRLTIVGSNLFDQHYLRVRSNHQKCRGENESNDPDPNDEGLATPLWILKVYNIADWCRYDGLLKVDHYRAGKDVWN